MESEFPGINRIKIVIKKILLGSLGTQHQATFAMISFFKETDKFFELNCYTKVFSMLNSTLV